MNLRSRTAAPLGASLLLIGLTLAWMPSPTGMGGAQQEPSAGTPASAATVDMVRLFRHSAQWRDAMARHEKLRADSIAEIEPLARRLNILEQECQSKPPGTPERTQALAEYDKARTDLVRKRQEGAARIARHYDDCYGSLVAELDGAVAGYAAAHGIDLVLKRRPSGLEPGRQGVADMTVEQVIYSAPRLDITDAILDKLNADYGAPIEVQ
jgi:Skp family chaperone for outer membrane proteins